MDAEGFRRQLRKLLDDRQMSLPALARATSYTRGYVWEIASGRKTPNLEAAKAFDRVLGAGGTLVRFLACPDGASAGFVEVSSLLSPPAGVSVDPTPPTGDGGAGPMRRRDILAGLTAVTAATLWLSEAQAATGGIPARLEALVLANITPTAASPDQPIGEALGAARTAFDRCDYNQLSLTLPGVLAAAYRRRNATTGQQRERSSSLLADGYRLASELAVKLDDNPVAWVLADRALDAARDSGNPVSIAAATRSVAIAMRRAGHHHGAVTLLVRAAQTLDPQVEAYGKLLCTAAYSAAQAGDRDQAAELVGEAFAAVSRPGSGSVFNEAAVNVYRIGVFTTLGDSGSALTYARAVDPTMLPTPERYARYCVDTARAWHLHGNTERAYHALRAAEVHAPQEVRRPSVRSLISTLLYDPQRTPEGLRELASRTGAAF